MGVVFSGYVTDKTEEGVEFSLLSWWSRSSMAQAAAGSAAASALFRIREFLFLSHPLVNY